MANARSKFEIYRQNDIQNDDWTQTWTSHLPEKYHKRYLLNAFHVAYKNGIELVKSLVEMIRRWNSVDWCRRKWASYSRTDKGAILNFLPLKSFNNLGNWSIPTTELWLPLLTSLGPTERIYDFKTTFQNLVSFRTLRDRKFRFNQSSFLRSLWQNIRPWIHDLALGTDLSLECKLEELADSMKWEHETTGSSLSRWRYVSVCTLRSVSQEFQVSTFSPSEQKIWNSTEKDLFTWSFPDA